MPMTFDERQILRADMVSMTESLVVEFAGRIPAGAVIGCVARSREHLLKTGVRAGLVPATEAAARRSLQATLPARACL